MDDDEEGNYLLYHYFCVLNLGNGAYWDNNRNNECKNYKQNSDKTWDTCNKNLNTITILNITCSSWDLTLHWTVQFWWLYNYVLFRHSFFHPVEWIWCSCCFLSPVFWCCQILRHSPCIFGQNIQQTFIRVSEERKIFCGPAGVGGDIIVNGYILVET